MMSKIQYIKLDRWQTVDITLVTLHLYSRSKT